MLLFAKRKSIKISDWNKFQSVLPVLQFSIFFIHCMNTSNNFSIKQFLLILIAAWLNEKTRTSCMEFFENWKFHKIDQVIRVVWTKGEFSFPWTKLLLTVGVILGNSYTLHYLKLTSLRRICLIHFYLEKCHSNFTLFFTFQGQRVSSCCTKKEDMWKKSINIQTGKPWSVWQSIVQNTWDRKFEYSQWHSSQERWMHGLKTFIISL